MSYKCHVASKYDVKFNAACWSYDDFDKYYSELLDTAEECEADTGGFFKEEYSDIWELDKGPLKEILAYLSDRNENPDLQDFIANLLDTSDSNISFVRIEAW